MARLRQTLSRGDLSAPVLAIIVTVGVITAGLAIMAWFWWFAPQVGRVGVLQVLGQPVVDCAMFEEDFYPCRAVVSIKNIGSVPVAVYSVLINGTEYRVPEAGGVVIPPGGSKLVKVELVVKEGGSRWREYFNPSRVGYSIEGALVTDSGTYLVTFYVIKR